MENFNLEQDNFFVSELLVPYLSAVYFGLTSQQKKGYLTISKMKNYLNLPELISKRIVKQINANGDERIDHDEFSRFFVQLFMGTHEQKMLIAFNCYDADGDQQIDKDEIKIVLNNIPLSDVKKNHDHDNKFHESRLEYLNHKMRDR